MKKPALLSWSSGKDSAWSLQVLNQQNDIEIVGLFSTVNQEFNRVAMHAVRVELLQLQAVSVRLPIQLIPIPYPCSNSQYESIMNKFIEKTKANGIKCFAFGDLYLEDVRKYRENNLVGTGINPVFPLWGMNTKSLSEEMIDSGLKARITCVDPKQLSADFAGIEYDKSFLERIPDNIDPCGENGEFHTFVYDGPMFKERIKISAGETISRDGFVFTDLLPETE
ncbi:MAG TPA: hypothetical protein VMV32_08985 [Ignavibacteriaceae bacterium]|nr:hypothetical protein [Ignavibacteriaceae bacterium]